MESKLKLIFALAVLILSMSKQVTTASAQENYLTPSLVWERVDSSNMPSPRGGFSMTLNTDNQLAMLFGGTTYDDYDSSNELWLTNGRQWIEFPTLHHPSGRSGASLVYDQARQEAVLFGGYDGRSFSFFNDTWIFNGRDWVEQNTQVSPSPRVNASMVYDTEHKRTYLFGGSYYFEKDVWLYNDTWSWDGSHWEQLFPAAKPSVRHRAPMVYDPVHHNVLLYRGDGYAAPRYDTWSWDGETWVEQHPVHQPTLNDSLVIRMVFDASRQQILMICVQSSSSPPNYWTETWAWDGQDWTQLPVILPLPPELVNGQPIYLPELKTVAVVNTFLQKVYHPGEPDTVVERSEVWALVERYVHFLPLASQ